MHAARRPQSGRMRSARQLKEHKIFGPSNKFSKEQRAHINSSELLTYLYFLFLMPHAKTEGSAVPRGESRGLMSAEGWEWVHGALARVSEDGVCVR